MKTWDQYKEHAKTTNVEIKEDIEKVEHISKIIMNIINKEQHFSTKKA